MKKGKVPWDLTWNNSVFLLCKVEHYVGVPGRGGQCQDLLYSKYGSRPFSCLWFSKIVWRICITQTLKKLILCTVQIDESTFLCIMALVCPSFSGPNYHGLVCFQNCMSWSCPMLSLPLWFWNSLASKNPLTCGPLLVYHSIPVTCCLIFFLIIAFLSLKPQLGICEFDTYILSLSSVWALPDPAICPGFWVLPGPLATWGCENMWDYLGVGEKRRKQEFSSSYFSFSLYVSVFICPDGSFLLSIVLSHPNHLIMNYEFLIEILIEIFPDRWVQ